MASLEQYQDKYKHIRMTRSNGILEVALHTNNGSLVWGAGPHSELPLAFADIGSDRENRVMILTGTGADFCGERDTSTSAARGTGDGWYNIYWEGKRLLENLLNIEIPVIAAVNGPARYHAEIAAMSDIVLASKTALFQDKAHFVNDIVPGDGVQIIWQMLLGPNRARHFLLTGQEISAELALQLGVVAEIHQPGQLLDRARELAREISTKSTLTLRYTRIALTQRMKKLVLDELGYGLSVEGLALMARDASDRK